MADEATTCRRRTLLRQCQRHRSTPPASEVSGYRHMFLLASRVFFLTANSIPIYIHKQLREQRELVAVFMRAMHCILVSVLQEIHCRDSAKRFISYCWSSPTTKGG